MGENWRYPGLAQKYVWTNVLGCRWCCRWLGKENSRRWPWSSIYFEIISVDCDLTFFLLYSPQLFIRFLRDGDLIPQSVLSMSAKDSWKLTWQISTMSWKFCFVLSVEKERPRFLNPLQRFHHPVSLDLYFLPLFPDQPMGLSRLMSRSPSWPFSGWQPSMRRKLWAIKVRPRLTNELEKSSDASRHTLFTRAWMVSLRNGESKRKEGKLFRK